MCNLDGPNPCPAPSYVGMYAAGLCLLLCGIGIGYLLGGGSIL